MAIFFPHLMVFVGRVFVRSCEPRKDTNAVFMCVHLEHLLNLHL